MNNEIKLKRFLDLHVWGTIMPASWLMQKDSHITIAKGIEKVDGSNQLVLVHSEY